MQTRFQSHFSTIVKANEGNIWADSYYLSTQHEAAGHIRARTADFIIEAAGWNVYRSCGVNETGQASVSQLAGQEAYFNIGPALSNAFGEKENFQKELVAECVRGIIQAETYVYQARGFESPESYDREWKKFYANSCRYYSNLDRVSTEWHQHVGKQARKSFLFHRNKTVSISFDSGKLLITGSFSDSFHQLAVNVTLADGVIANCTGNLLRAPDNVCFESKTYLTEIIGLKMSELNKKAIAKALGGSQGCIHLIDIFSEMVRSFGFFTAIAGE